MTEPNTSEAFNLADASTQDVFDYVVTKLIEQGRPSISKFDSSLCAYRGTEGRRCAIGWILPDDEYRESLEGTSADSLASSVSVNVAPSIREWCRSSPDRTEFLLALQAAHDAVEDIVWTDGFCRAALEVADRFDLNPAILTR